MPREYYLQHRDEFHGLLNERRPFGPWVAETITGVEFAERALFDTENLAHLEALESKPSFIIGRRGSGKTAFLHSPSTRDGAHPLELHTSEAFSLINQVITHWGELGIPVYLSHSRTLWRTAIWHAIFAELLSKYGADEPTLEPVSLYLSGLVPDADKRPMSAFRRFCTEVKSRTTSEEQSLAFDSESFSSHGVEFRAAQSASLKALADRRADVLVLLDSMEDFERIVDIPNQAMQGLLSLAGERGAESKPFRLRVAIPAELYHAVKEMSYNPNKDFAGSVILHWSAAELIRLAARRFAIFALLHHQDSLTRIGLGDMDPDDDEVAVALLRTVMPGEMTNSLGGSEDSIAYLLRHTQLIPRHFLILANRAWTVSRSEGLDGLQISASAVVRAVRDAEGDIVDEICKAYEPVHPTAAKMCRKLVPHISFRVSDSTLHQMYNQHAKEPGVDLRYVDAKALLIEIGAIGRWIGETDRYIEAEFEYTMPNRLGIAGDEELLLHPLFAGVFGSRETQPNGSQGRRAVYPFGCDPDGPDFRLDRPA